MGRDKRQHQKTAPHIRVELSLLNSPAYIALNWTARALYIDMRSKLRSYNNGNIDAAFTELKHKGWRSPTTLAKALQQLEAVGLIKKTRKTIGVTNGSKVCNLYRFTDQDSFEFPKLGISAVSATHDYRNLTSLKEAKQAIASASYPKKKTTLQKMYRDATDSVLIGEFNASNSVVTSIPSTTETVSSRKAKKGQKPSIHAGYAVAQVA